MPDTDYSQHLLEVARMMELAARTAPKAKGEDFVKIATLSGPAIGKLADAMLHFGKITKKLNFDRDAIGVRKCPAIVLIGLKDAKTAGLDCGACGFNSCSGLENATHPKTEFNGPNCAFRILDMGIALGSAVKTAQIMNADNRIMYRIGVAARHAKIIDWDIALGIPLSATGKNIFFDRT
jgi:uncharacterized ferredoxin-like protein